MRVRKNMSWLELGFRIMKVDLLHPSIQNVARGSTRRGMKWYAYRVTEVNKGGQRQQYGQWLWVPKANLIGHVDIAPPGSGGFIRAKGPNVQSSVRWERGHPLARNVKEVWYAYNWGHSRRGKLDRYYGGVSVSPSYEHWLEAREVAKRERRTISPWDKWRSEMSEPFHSAWMMHRSSKGNCGKNAARNPRITIQFYRDKKGVIRRWGTDTKAKLPDRHVLLVDYLHKGIFDTWKKSGGRNFELVKHLANPRRKRRR